MWTLCRAREASFCSMFSCSEMSDEVETYFVKLWREAGLSLEGGADAAAQGASPSLPRLPAGLPAAAVAAMQKRHAMQVCA